MGERGLGLSGEGGKMFQDENITSHILRKAGPGRIQRARNELNQTGGF